jgi:hypothetical protein
MQKLSYDFVKTRIQSEADLDLVDSSDRTAAHYVGMYDRFSRETATAD